MGGLVSVDCLGCLHLRSDVLGIQGHGGHSSSNIGMVSITSIGLELEAGAAPSSVEATSATSPGVASACGSAGAGASADSVEANSP